MLWGLKARIYDWCRSRYPFSRIYRQELAALSELIKNTAACHTGGRLLDVGSGTGSTLRAVVPDAKGVVAVDRSIDMLHMNEGNGKDIRRIVADATALPFKNRCFDTITAVGVFEYVKDSAQFLGEMARVGRPGSKTILTYADDSLWNRCRHLLGHMIYLKSEADFAALLDNHSFVIRDQRTSLLQKQVLMHKRL